MTTLAFDDELRSEYDHAVMQRNRYHRGRRTLHIPIGDGGDEPLCSTFVDAREKSLSVIPPEYWEWCERCVSIWQYGEDLSNRHVDHSPEVDG